MNPALEAVFDRLADGRAHKAQGLADALNISRADVQAQIETLRGLGLYVATSPGEDYRLPSPLQRPSVGRIVRRLDQPIDVESRFLVDSTNDCLMRERGRRPPPRALIAEAQSRGRGRRGRGWVSPPGAGLYLSLSWRFNSGLTRLSALSLVTGVAVARVLDAIGLATLRLKWPNDLWVDDQKLGGCLIEINGAAEGPCDAVTGIGLNLDLGEAGGTDQPWTDLARQGITPDRDALLADLLNALALTYRELDRAGFGAFESEWSGIDALKDRRIQVFGGGGNPIEGVARGVDQKGRLLLETSAGVRTIGSGEVSVRRC